MLKFSSAVQKAKANGQPLVALESTIISHGLPYPKNLEVAQQVEAIVREEGAEPATIALRDGYICIGLEQEELEQLAIPDSQVSKVSRRDMATVLARGGLGATTVAGTMICAAKANIRIFATGGIGGVHRGAEDDFDISADIPELAQQPVAVVCAGAKSILDLPKTLEALETAGVPLLGFNTNEFPSFFTQSSGIALEHRANTPAEVAQILGIQDQLGLSQSLLICNPVPKTDALKKADETRWINQALNESLKQGIVGKDITPFLLKRLVELSHGKTLNANLALIKSNVRLASQIACELKGR